MKPPTTPPDGECAAFVIATPLEQLAAAAGRDIRLDSCSELEWIIVRTRNSTYELIVLSGDTGEVLVRGGEFFKEFTHAMVTGSMLGGSVVKLRTICAGCRLELRLDGTPLVTSRVNRVSRHRMPVAQGADVA